MPSAAWINPEAASAALPLAGRRRIRSVGAEVSTGRCRVFITSIYAHFGMAQDPKTRQVMT